MHGYCGDADGADDVVADLTAISGLDWPVSNIADLGQSVWPSDH